MVFWLLFRLIGIVARLAFSRLGTGYFARLAFRETAVANLPLDITTLHIINYTLQNGLYITILVSDYVNFT